MTIDDPIEILLHDPLREATRRERRVLLAVSMVCFALRVTGSFPQSISSLGITLSTSDRHSLIKFLTLIDFYLIVVFVLYGIADFVSWRRSFQSAVRQVCSELGGSVEFNQTVYDSSLPGRRWKWIAEEAELKAAINACETHRKGFFATAFRVAPFVIIRVFIEFGLPLAMGIVSLIALLTWSIPATKLP